MGENKMGSEEMLSLFYVDGSRLFMTHFCPSGNQPRMQATISPDLKTISFDFLDATNLPNLQAGHMHHATYFFPTPITTARNGPGCRTAKTQPTGPKCNEKSRGGKISAEIILSSRPEQSEASVVEESRCSADPHFPSRPIMLSMTTLDLVDKLQCREPEQTHRHHSRRRHRQGSHFSSGQSHCSFAAQPSKWPNSIGAPTAISPTVSPFPPMASPCWRATSTPSCWARSVIRACLRTFMPRKFCSVCASKWIFMPTSVRCACWTLRCAH